MEVIIKWLREVEHLAGEVYTLAASEYDDDPKLKKFLERSAEDVVSRIFRTFIFSCPST